MGLDVEVFVDQVNNDLLCPFCTKVLEDPVASACGHTFCNPCLQKALSKKCKVCPKCDQDLTMVQITPACDKLIEELGRLSLHCKNQTVGCKTVANLEDMEDHLGRECQYRSVQCEYKGCESLVPTIDLQEHMDTCDYRMVECRVCKVCVPRKDMPAHQAVKRCFEQLNKRRMVSSARRISQELKEHRVDLLHQRHLTEQTERHLLRNHYAQDESLRHRRAVSAGPVLMRKSIETRIGSATVNVPHYSRNLKSATLDACRGCTNKFTAGRQPSARRHSHSKVC